MEFRADAKELSSHSKRMGDFKTFKERGVYRVDWCYGMHVIKGGNNYQR